MSLLPAVRAIPMAIFGADGAVAALRERTWNGVKIWPSRSSTPAATCTSLGAAEQSGAQASTKRAQLLLTHGVASADVTAANQSAELLRRPEQRAVLCVHRWPAPVLAIQSPNV